MCAKGEREGGVRCLFNEGLCPETCSLHERARRIQAEDPDFNWGSFRQQILFADASDHGINVNDIARLLSACEIEAKKPTQYDEDDD